MGNSSAKLAGEVEYVGDQKNSSPSRISQIRLSKAESFEEDILIEFIWTEGGKDVKLAGDFLNKWQAALEMEQLDGIFKKSMVFLKSD